ncbi:MAG: AMP-binding protein [Anaerovoracaceae bacterium]
MNKEKYDGVYYDHRKIKDLKDLIISSSELYKDLPAYLVKDRPGAAFRPITFGQVREEMDALGTSFLKLGLKGKKIAVIGENSYYWLLTYFATVCGVGTIVPLDRNLPPEEVVNLINRAEVGALVFSKSSEKSITQLIDTDHNIEHFICMGTDEHVPNCLSLPKLIEEGKELVREGIREFVDAEVNAEEMSTLMFTSGTTGLAKGVMLSHKNISQNVYNMSKLVTIREHGIGLSVLPMHHVYEMTYYDLLLSGIDHSDLRRNKIYTKEFS